MQIALVDHYDSFTFNVLDWLATGGRPGRPDVDVRYVAADDAAALAALAQEPVPLVISPGPKRPEDAPLTAELLRRSLGRVPVLGVCLGHQLLAHVAGARIVRSAAPVHGTTREIQPVAPAPGAAPDLFAGLGPFRAATYNSLVVAPGTLPPPWRVTAVCDQGEIQGLAWTSPDDPALPPAFGLQFHPESFLSEAKDRLRANWLAAVQAFRSPRTRPCPPLRSRSL